MNTGCGRTAALAVLVFLFPLIGGVGSEREAFGSFNARRYLLTNLSTRIKDGHNAPRNRYPYFVSLRTLGTFVHFCGAVLVEPDLVVTAAHCVDSLASTKSGVSEPIAVISPHGINDDKADGVEVISTVKTVVHEKWIPGDFLNGYDIAVLFLKTPSTRQPIQIAPPDVPGFGQKLTATGFGGMAGTKYSPTLRQAMKLDFVPNKNCNRPDVYKGKIKERMVCALDLVTGQDTCQGDSGGPLVIRDKNSNPELDRLVGLVSFGPNPCGSGGIPGVYTRMSSFTTWIQETRARRNEPPPRPAPLPPQNSPQQGSQGHNYAAPNAASTGMPEELKQLAKQHECPAGVPCENEKMRVVNGVETVCKCMAWMESGSCHEKGWYLMEGPGDCAFETD